MPLTVTFNEFLYKEDCDGKVFDLEIFTFFSGYFFLTVLKDVTSPSILTIVTNFILELDTSLSWFLVLVFFEKFFFRLPEYPELVSKEWWPSQKLIRFE